MSFDNMYRTNNEYMDTMPLYTLEVFYPCAALNDVTIKEREPTESEILEIEGSKFATYE